jgi:hypothetical protein
MLAADALCKRVNPTEDEETGTKRSSGSLAASRLQSKKDHWDGEYTEQTGQHANSRIRHARLKVVLSNVLEVEVAIETRQPRSQRYE